MKQPMGDDWPFITFSRCFSEFAKSADQGCAICWVLASLGRLWDDSIDPAPQIGVGLFPNGDQHVLCGKYKLAQGLDIYIPKESFLCQ